MDFEEFLAQCILVVCETHDGFVGEEVARSHISIEEQAAIDYVDKAILRTPDPGKYEWIETAIREAFLAGVQWKTQHNVEMQE